MWVTLLIIHGLLAFLLLGAVTHQAVSVWAPLRAGAGHFMARYRAVGSAHYTNAVIVLYLITAIVGAIIYTNFRLTVRLTLMQDHFLKSAGAFDLKEHMMAIGVGLLPAYWYFWQPSRDADAVRTRIALTTLLAVIVWWGFLIGHFVNNIQGLGT
jgi:hypothetical protein